MLDLKQSQQWHEQQVTEAWADTATHPLYIYPGQVAPAPVSWQTLEINVFPTPRSKITPVCYLTPFVIVTRQIPKQLDCVAYLKRP